MTMAMTEARPLICLGCNHKFETITARPGCPYCGGTNVRFDSEKVKRKARHAEIAALEEPDLAEETGK